MKQKTTPVWWTSKKSAGHVLKFSSTRVPGNLVSDTHDATAVCTRVHTRVQECTHCSVCTVLYTHGRVGTDKLDPVLVPRY